MRRPIINETVIERHFPKAKITRTLMGWKITTPTGWVYLNQRGFKDPVGGADLFRGMVSLCGEVFGGLQLYGPPEVISAGMAHSAQQNVPAVPLVKTGDGCAIFFACFFAGLIAWGITGWMGCATGSQYTASAITAVVIFLLCRKESDKDARRRGQPYLDAFPPAFASVHEREATKEMLRKKGLIQ